MQSLGWPKTLGLGKEALASCMGQGLWAWGWAGAPGTPVGLLGGLQQGPRPGAASSRLGTVAGHKLHTRSSFSTTRNPGSRSRQRGSRIRGKQMKANY